jgi:acyl-CoA thioesterase FadM
VYEIVKADGGPLIAGGKTVMVSYDYATGRSMPLPAETRALLEAARAGGSDQGLTQV